MAQQQDTPRWMVDEVDQLVTTDDYRQLSMIAESYARVAARHLADGAVGVGAGVRGRVRVRGCGDRLVVHDTFRSGACVVSWEVMEQPHELRYHCPQCPWTVTAPALDPIADEAIRAHEASHDAALTARWASSHVASRHMWDLTPRRVRDRWGDIAGALMVLVGGLLLVALLGGWF